MAVFTFVCKHTGGSWSAKQRGGDLEGSAANPLELQKQMRDLALQSAGAGAVSVDFALITPSAGVLQVIVGGGAGGAAFASGGGAPAAGGAAAAAPAPAEEEKKEEKEASEDEDMGFSLFD
ncbi:hypothetical protein SELMODRAFT_112966 [Selaginella moellendorffii]|uniref:60S acidic ribosomal protein P3 n=1 Tax=Selaginella moellendorffii TaxID=88036 RepID=D8SB36_SELML|nr:60S acidic ribosomal protein P3-1 [Selaginella moellendorffii]EFJ18183.1 hypothetical protein SELMODRAFT_112966 [Selaginella moellendorffii]|eukprot:XP_002980532.1 60S acidic ribosomal protein P3-1 [Selaginella moellendorffii]